MKITFLGTSHGIPAADRWCSTTVLEACGNIYAVDAGAPLIDLLLRRGIPVEKLRAVFVTHMHGDHVNGVIPLVDLANWAFKGCSPYIYLTEEKGISLVRDMVRLMEGEALDENRIRLKLMDAGVRYDDGALRITPLPTRHLEDQGRPSFAYLAEADGRSCLFTGDLSGGLQKEDFPAYALEHEVDALVIEMAHFSPDQVLPYLRECRAKQILFTHVFPLTKLEDIAHMGEELGVPVRAVADGDELIL